MRYSVCVIDDTIPAAGVEGMRDSELLNSSNLQFLLGKDELWTDAVIKNLVGILLNENDTDGTPKWDVFGFTNPSFYLTALDEGLFRCDLIIYDWEYPGTGAGAGTDPEGILKEILEKTFCLVFILSGVDREAEIHAVLAKPEFQEYRERLHYLDKKVDEVDQTATLLRAAEGMYTKNFSFRFASVLRKKALQSIDRVLSDMGRASLNDIKNHVAIGDSGKKDFVDFLAEKFRTAVAGKDIYDLVDQIPDPAVGEAPDESLARKVWSYRLYFHRDTGDDLVRRGDIVKIGEAFSLVISADCDLVRFWKKNLGIINTVALHELDQTNANLKELLTLCVNANKIPKEVPSLLGTIGELAEGPFVLPFVPVQSGTKNLLAIPKEMKSERITVPAGWTDFTKEQRKDHPMKYSYWAGADRVCTISEPFLTPVIQHVLNVLGGNGVPDYPDNMKTILKNILTDFSSTPAAPQR